jgi:hypothetical protein
LQGEKSCPYVGNKTEQKETQALRETDVQRRKPAKFN